MWAKLGHPAGKDRPPRGGREKSASHSTSGPADGTSGGRSDANTIRSATRTRSTCFADLNDNAVRLVFIRVLGRQFVAYDYEETAVDQSG
jgi:hypothetical protein